MKEKFKFSRAMTKLPKWHVRPAKTWISLASALPDQSSISTWKGFGFLAIPTAHGEDWSDWADAQADLSRHCAYKSFCWSYRTAAPFSYETNFWLTVYIIDGRLKDCSLVAYFDNMIYVYHHALNHFKTEIFSYQYFANYLPCVIECAAKTLVIDWDTFFRAK